MNGRVTCDCVFVPDMGRVNNRIECYYITGAITPLSYSNRIWIILLHDYFHIHT